MVIPTIGATDYISVYVSVWQDVRQLELSAPDSIFGRTVNRTLQKTRLGVKIPYRIVLELLD